MASFRQTPAPLRLIRLTRMGLHLGQGVLTAALIFPFLGQTARTWLIRSWSAKLLALLAIRLSVHGAPPQPGGKGGLVVANHISWLDIYALNAVEPLRFVSKAEVSEWPVVGYLARSAGTLFIRRGKRQDTGRTNRDIENALRSGNLVALFPEGTTTDGTELKHFHASLLQPAIDAQAPLYPVALRFLREDGGIDTAPAYIGDLSFGDCLKQILSRPSIRAELRFGDAIQPHGHSRRELAGYAHNRITNALFPAPHDRKPETTDDLPDAPPTNSPPTNTPYPAPAD